MKLDSKYFDMIRISRAGAKPGQTRHARACCDWRGCGLPGLFQAPKAGAGTDGGYVFLCAEHIREHNAAYDFFDGMSDAEIADFQKAAVYGHRPTWKIGSTSWPDPRTRRDARFGARGFARTAGRPGVAGYDPDASGPAPKPRRQLKPLERKSLDCLGLRETATRAEIKARFKELVKRNHPDSNGGDRGSEEKLREIIQAYNYLKAAGLV